MLYKAHVFTFKSKFYTGGFVVGNKAGAQEDGHIPSLMWVPRMATKQV